MKATLYDLIGANKTLRFIDPYTDRSFTLADFHQSMEIPSGKGLAFLYLDNGIASVEALLNFLRSRWAICLLSPKLDAAYKAQLETAYQPGCIYDAGRTTIPGYEQQRFASGNRLFYTNTVPGYPIDPVIKLLLSTSGSTGSPKMVKLSEDNLVQNAMSILNYLPVCTDDVTPLNLPLFYSYGLSVFTTNALAGGSILCTNEDIIRKAFWDDWERYGCTSLAGVPYVYEMLFRFGLMPQTQPSLRYMTQAGGKMNLNLLQQCRASANEYHFPFYTMYGQTEATARMSWLAPEQLEQKADSIGKPVKNGSFAIDPSNGELLYSGPNVFGGYAENNTDLAVYQQQEVLSTGDLAEQDADGFYYITGRIKRFVKLFGTRINLDEVEHILKQQFPGKTLLCLGNNDQYLQVMHIHAELDAPSLKQFLSSRLHIHPNAIRVQQLATFPLTSNGKPDYAAAQQMSCNA